MRKSSVLTLALIFSIVVVLAASALPIPMTTQADPETTVYLDIPTINGTIVNQTLTVNVMIRDAVDIYSWQAGLLFNATVLNCTGFNEGTFLSNVSPNTFWLPGVINNTIGMISYHGATFLGDNKASGDGTLGYLTFKVKTLGVSDLHIRDVIVTDYYSVGPGKVPEMVPFNIIDVYTVIVDTTVHKVVTVSNSTGFTQFMDPKTGDLVIVHSGFSDYALNLTLKEISFKVTGPYAGLSNVAIPKTLAVPENLLNASTLDKWRVIIDRKAVKTEDITVTQNGTHHFIYFTYSKGVHEVVLTTRPVRPSNIFIALSEDSITLEESVTISGNVTAEDPTDPLRPNATVYFEYRKSGTQDGWTTVPDTVQTDNNSKYNYAWIPEEAGTLEVRARWDGDAETLPAESEPQPLEVLKEAKGIDPLIIAAVVIVVLIVVAIAVYFLKFRKPEEE